VPIRICNVEYCLPDCAVTNEDINTTNPQWDIEKIEAKSGVKTRYRAAPGETALDLAVKACEKLFAADPEARNGIDALIFCTQSPDHIMPPNSYILQARLGLRRELFAFDYNLACSGYVYGLAISKALLESGVATRVLLVNADTYSRYINPRDRSTGILFSDAAAATIIAKELSQDSEIIDLAFESSGGNYEMFYIPAGGIRLPRGEGTSIEAVDQSGNYRSAENIHMNGFGIWRFIATEAPLQIKGLLKRNGIAVDGIDIALFHQASKLTLDSLVKSLAIPREKVYINLERVGNCVSASIPIALKDAELEGRLKRGDIALLSGFGVGLSLASAIIKY
jgi:3-oxoacyl-[acyl-carrier-protein] synthase III